jgi:hypothetical protein
MALIKCSECDSEISENAVSCPKCGNPIKPDNTIRNQPIKKPFRWQIVFFSISLGFLLLMTSLYLIDKIAEANRLRKYQVEQAAYVPTEHSVEIVHGSIIVQSYAYKFYEFSIRPSAYNHRIIGRFSASGGTGDDIRVLVMTKDDFTNFKNGHKSNCFYDSGKTTVANFDVSLPSTDQKYVLVFDNTFSVVTNKEINTDINYICTY